MKAQFLAHAMNKYFTCTIALITLYSSCFAISSSAVLPPPIYQDSAKMDHLGYMNCKMEANGEYTAIKEYIKSGNIVFDVGAHRGKWSTHVITQQPNVRIYAFEPVPQAYTTLLRNLINLPVSTFNLALSNHTGTQSFVSYKKTKQTHALDGSSKSSFFHQLKFEQEYEKGIAQEITVPTITLDDFCKKHQIDHINYLKIDTEGAEHLILKGAHNLLKNKRIQHIQFEYGNTYIGAKAKLEDVFKLLTSYNYKVFRLLSNGLLHIKKWRPQLETFKYSNYLAIADTQQT